MTFSHHATSGVKKTLELGLMAGLEIQIAEQVFELKEFCCDARQNDLLTTWVQY